MKYLIVLSALLITMSACKKDRTPGVCYCTFVKGADKEYDLNNLTRQEQIDQCNTHDNNAAHFGGKCELE